MAEHTPGPWSDSDDRRRVDLENGCDVSNWAEIRDATGRCIGAAYCGGSYEHNLANARLMASAPETAAERDRLRAEKAELLAALERIANEPIGPPEASAAEVLAAVVEIARAAIARTRGERS
jgi:hypothetical protein